MLTRVPCPDCGNWRPIQVQGCGLIFGPGHVCAKGAANPLETKETKVSKGAADAPAAPVARKWSAAKATDCGCGRRHPSKMQARVCARLRDSIANDCWLGGPVTLFHEVRMPLFGIAPKPDGKPFTICVDFVVAWPGGKVHQYVDAKAKGRVSRDWPARAAAFAAQYGQAIEEVSR